MEKTEATTNDGEMSHEAKLLAILQNPEERILPLLVDAHSTDPQIQKAKEQTTTELIEIVQHFFKEIEQTAKKYHEIANANRKNKGDITSSLSGLAELYIPPTSDEVPPDVETLWGQVELQNNALNKLLKKSIKNLAKAPEDIVLLDMDLLSSDEENDDDGDQEKEGGDYDFDGSRNEESEEEQRAMNDDGDDSDEDEEAKRIRARMERAMQEAGSDDDDDEVDEEEEEEGDEDDSGTEDDKEPSPPPPAKDESKEELYDPVAEEMKDGFFDLIDMEDYADEEEDYLPQEAFGENKQENKKKKEQKSQKTKSFHQKQRDGDFLNRDQEDDDDDENFEELYEEDEATVPLKRKKYREDEEIDALYTLYQPAAEEDDEAEDAVNMTAADFFGAPSKQYMERYQAKKAKEEVKDDDDSWGEYDFEQDRSGGDVDDDDNDENDDHANPSYIDESSHDEEVDDEDEDEDDETKHTNSQDIKKGKDRAKDNSRYTKQQEKLRQQTQQLEAEMLSEKPWQMIGESKGTSRPVNSLLEGTPEFEFASKQAPTITVEHTANIEDVIKKRILAEDWDDVVPRELPDVRWHMKRGELPEVSQEKSKLGLGELYEREYLKKAVGYDKDAEEKLSEEDKAKEEMKQLFANLCSKLDGLSNYHFAPRPIAEEVEVKAASTPAIAMEEVLPLHVNDARAVAPEEVYATKRGREGVLRGETEMDQRERKRLRQSKKAARRKARQEKRADEKLISRLQPGLGLNNPYEKRKMREELAVARSKGKVSMGEQDMDDKYGSSGTFFQRLQTEAQRSIKGQSTGGESERTKKSKPKSSALKL